MLSPRAKLVTALLLVWVIWGSIYLAMQLALESFAPLGMSALRIACAGVVIMAVARWRGESWPDQRTWRVAALVGPLLFMVGNGSAVVAAQTVSSSLVAIMVGAVPLYAVVITWMLGTPVSPRQWTSLALGLAGIVTLNGGAELSRHWGTAAILTVGALGWALGSVLSKRAAPPSPAMATGAQMLVGGAALAIAAVATGEGIPATASATSVAALGYLFLFGTVIGFSAYAYLLRNTSLAVATSYAYVNPLVAVGLGYLFAGESLDAWGWCGLAMIVVAVVGLTLPAKSG